MSSVTLYQRRSIWGLPSLSPADTQVQVRRVHLLFAAAVRNIA